MKLALDTSSGNVAIAIESDGKIYVKKSESDFQQAEEVAVMLKDLCVENNLLVTEIKEIYCVIGPGSFTAVRVLVAFVKGFVLGRDVKVFPISKFYYYLANVISKFDSFESAEIFIHCGKNLNEFFYHKILKNYQPDNEPKILNFSDLNFSKKDSLIISDFNFEEKFSAIKNFFQIFSSELKIEDIFRLPDMIYYYRLEPLYIKPVYVSN